MSEGKDDESLSIGDLDGVASGYVYDTGESVEVIDNEGNVVESFALNKRSLTRRLPSPLPTVVALQHKVMSSNLVSPNRLAKKLFGLTTGCRR